MVNTARGPQVNIGQSVEAGPAHPKGEFATPLTSTGPSSALTEHAAMSAAFGGDLVESTKSSGPCATPGVPEALDPTRTNTLHRKLGFIDLYHTGNKLTRNG